MGHHSGEKRAEDRDGEGEEQSRPARMGETDPAGAGARAD